MLMVMRTDAANDDAAARVQCVETLALPKHLCDVTPQKFAKQLVISDDGTAKTNDGVDCKSRALKFIYIYFFYFNFSHYPKDLTRASPL